MPYGAIVTPRTRATTPALFLALLTLTACGPSPDEFRDSDPMGYQACERFESADGAGGDVYHSNIGSAAELGLKSTTPEIRDAVDDRNGGAEGAPVIPDHGDFRDACKAAGYSFG